MDDDLVADQPDVELQHPAEGFPCPFWMNLCCWTEMTALVWPMSSLVVASSLLNTTGLGETARIPECS